MRPPERRLMRSATRSADMPGPGSRRGHEVTMRHFVVCARATAGAATAPTAVTPAPMVNLRRVVLMALSYAWHDLRRKAVTAFRNHANARESDAAAHGRARSSGGRHWRSLW